MQKVKIITHLSCLIRYIAGGPEKDPVAGILASSASARKRAQTRRFFTEKSSEKEYPFRHIAVFALDAPLSVKKQCCKHVLSVARGPRVQPQAQVCHRIKRRDPRGSLRAPPLSLPLAMKIL